MSPIRCIRPSCLVRVDQGIGGVVWLFMWWQQDRLYSTVIGVEEDYEERDARGSR